MIKSKTVMLFLCLAPSTALFSGQSGSNTPSVETIVSRMVQARRDNQAHFQPYTVTRDYQLFGKQETQAKSQVTAEVNFASPDSSSYSIRGSSGAGIGEGIVRRMLAGESEIAGNQNTDVTADNYDFRLVGEESYQNVRCFVLEISPKRTQKHLLRGKVWVDARTYLMRRLEGEPVKKPSWWVKDIHIKLFYSDVNGMWLQTGLVATAEVRIAGPCKMISRDLQYSILDMASNQRLPRKRIIFPSTAMSFSD